MTSNDDSPLIGSMMIGKQWSEDVLDEQSRGTFGDDEDNDHDEGINDQLQLDSDEEEELILVLPTDSNNSIITETTDSHLHPLLENDISDVSLKISTQLLAGFSIELDREDSCLSILTFHLFTDFIEVETACQWQICNKKPLTCQISVHNESYVDEKVTVKRVFQLCPCHPANAVKVPFIERLICDYFEKTQINLDILKLSRAAPNPDLRLKYFLEIILDRSKRAQYQEMLLSDTDHALLGELIEYEILQSNEGIAKKLILLKPPRENPSNRDIHYDLTDPKYLPKLHHGYLVRFCKYMEYRLSHLNSLCVMCGKQTFSPDDKKVLKPTICDNYGCFSNAMDSKFRDDPLPPSIFSIEIADFLLLLVYAAIHSNRNELILDPYPRLINPYNTSTILLDQYGDKEKNIEMLREIIDNMMSMGSLTQYEVGKISLRSMIELKHPWAFSFFHWLMGTNRYHFSYIPNEYQFKNVHTSSQYFIKHEDIAKHVNFKKLRAENGSIFAFHGSPQENWHSILRSGLQIGKAGYLLNGAAYGNGIYVSPSSEFSSTYTRLRHSDIRHEISRDTTEMPPLANRNWSCIALCEIINSPDAYKKHSRDIWTIQDPNLICTRFIFFFPTGTIRTTMRVDSEAETTTIRELIHTLNTIAC